MEKRIEYQGMTSQPSDYVCPDGDMKLAVNAEYRDGGWKAVKEPKEAKYVLENFKPFITHSEDGKENLIGIAKLIGSKKIFLEADDGYSTSFEYYYENGDSQAIAFGIRNGKLCRFPFFQTENGAQSKSLLISDNFEKECSFFIEYTNEKIHAVVSYGEKKIEVYSEQCVGITYKKRNDGDIVIYLYYGELKLAENKSESWLINCDGQTVNFKNLDLHGERNAYSELTYRKIQKNSSSIKFYTTTIDDAIYLIIGDDVKIRVRDSESVVIRNNKFLSIIKKRTAEDFKFTQEDNKGEKKFEINENGYILYDNNELYFGYDECPFSIKGRLILKEGDVSYNLAYRTPNGQIETINAKCNSYDSVSSACVLGNSVVFNMDERRCSLVRSGGEYLFYCFDDIDLNLGFVASRVGQYKFETPYSENVSILEGDHQDYNTIITMYGEFWIGSDAGTSEELVLGKVEEWKSRYEEKGFFVFPVVVTYSFRLYDGSHINESTKILMFPKPDMFFIGTPDKSINSVGSNYEYEQIYLHFNPYKIMFGVFSKNDEESVDAFINKWNGIISGIDIYISKQIDLTSKIKKLDQLCIGKKSIYLTRAIKEAEKVVDFHHAKFIKLSELSSIAQFRYPETLENFTGTTLFPAYTKIEYGEDKSGANLNFLKDRMVYSDVMKSYNNRILLGSVKMRPAKPSPLWVACPPVSDYVQGKNNLPESLKMNSIYSKKFPRTYKIKNINIVFKNNEGKYICSNFKITEDKLNYVPNFYTYKEPYGGVLQVVLYGGNGDDYYRCDLKENPSGDSFLSFEDDINFSAFLENGVNIIQKDNVIVSTDVNNILVMDYESMIDLPTGKIFDIAISSFEVSTGQFGTFPVFAFCDVGLFAINFTNEGKILSSSPYSYMSCDEGTEVFAFKRELMFCNRNKIYKYSLNGTDDKTILDSTYIQEIYDNDAQKEFINKTINKHDMHFFDDKNFSIFKDAHMAFDPKHERIIIYSPKCNYFFLITGDKVSIIQDKQFCGYLRSVGNCYMMLQEENIDLDRFYVYDYSSDEVVDIQSSYFITRPFKLDMPDVHKSIQSIIQRGVFCGRKDVQQALYGSNDLYNWTPVWSSKDIYLRGMRGSGYKYYKLAIFIPKFNQDEILHGCSVEFTPRLTNKPR